ncbi:MAG: hypothetical protein M5U15_02635 [Kiritimatiellae bacterium]|nr:hypothetical protein [Kiritimatiellia bacterium]
MTASWVPILPLGDFIYAFNVSNFLSGKLIIFILFAFSIVAWTVMASKWLDLKRAQTAARRFLDAYRREQHPLALFFPKTENAVQPAV